MDLDLGGIFDDDDPLIIRNESRQDIEQCGFSRTGAATNQDVSLLNNLIFKLGGQALGQGADSNEVVDGEVPRVEFANGEGDPVDTAGWNDGSHTAAIG